MTIDEERFLNHLKEHYQVIDRTKLNQIANRFGVARVNIDILLASEGWQLEIASGHNDNFYHPAVKDRNSMINMTDFKKLNTETKEYIDDTEEETL